MRIKTVRAALGPAAWLACQPANRPAIQPASRPSGRRTSQPASHSGARAVGPWELPAAGRRTGLLAGRPTGNSPPVVLGTTEMAPPHLQSSAVRHCRVMTHPLRRACQFVEKSNDVSQGTDQVYLHQNRLATSSMRQDLQKNPREHQSKPST